jgi:hypothetical protein
MGFYKLKRQPNRDNLPKDWVVPPDRACPNCNERHTGFLHWLSSKTIGCKICGTKYRFAPDRTREVVN